MAEQKEKLSDPERKEAQQHSRRFGEWLRQGMHPDPQESPQAGGASPREAA